MFGVNVDRALSGYARSMLMLEGRNSEAIRISEDLRSHENYIRTRWGFEQVGLQDLDLQAVNASMVQLERVYKDFPMLKTFVKELKSCKPEIHPEPFSMICTNMLYQHQPCSMGTRLGFNSEAYSDVDRIKTDYADLVKQGKLVKGSSYEHAIVHELGHALQTYLTYHVFFKGKSYDGDRLPQTAFNILELLRNKAKEVEVQLREISGYAVTKAEEAIAEMFTDYYANGRKANSLSIDTVNYFKMKLAVC